MPVIGALHAIPGARCVEMTGAGHAATIQSAAAVNTRLLDDLESATLRR